MCIIYVSFSKCNEEYDHLGSIAATKPTVSKKLKKLNTICKRQWKKECMAVAVIINNENLVEANNFFLFFKKKKKSKDVNEIFLCGKQ